jgi:fatty acid desaturase
VLCGVLVAIGGWPLYVLAWLLPRLTWYQAISCVRDIVEHGMVPDADDPLRNARSIRAGVAVRVFLAPYWVNYHLEHHLMVFVPCWKLRRLHAHLLARGLGERIETASSYLRVLRGAASAR